jgi:hypothetical protein
MSNIPAVKIPTFDMTVPITGEKIKFRPFVVKEEKLLIMAAEADGYDDAMRAVKDVVLSCTFDKINADVEPLFVVQYAFLQIRGKSIGELIDFNLVCGTCKHETPHQLHIDDMKVETTEGHTNVVELGEGMTVTMRYPTFAHYTKFFGSGALDEIFSVVAECIDTITTEEESYTNDGSDIPNLVGFLNDLTAAQFDKIETFFATMPVVRHTINYKCKCGEKNQVVIDGITNFFE